MALFNREQSDPFFGPDGIFDDASSNHPTIDPHASYLQRVIQKGKLAHAPYLVAASIAGFIVLFVVSGLLLDMLCASSDTFFDYIASDTSQFVATNE